MSAPLGSGWHVEWRSSLGLVQHREHVWNERKAEDYAFDYRFQFPTMTPVLVGPRGGERKLRNPVRK